MVLISFNGQGFRPRSAPDGKEAVDSYMLKKPPFERRFVYTDFIEGEPFLGHSQSLNALPGDWCIDSKDWENFELFRNNTKLRANLGCQSSLRLRGEGWFADAPISFIRVK
ncbi:hypothetical protein ANO14919_023300 [Xylariales sp. No.14919]|nr:hypothetical protein ANO14919_023300 [Xylariales sp. No.14919]